jgi:hypothetical protein
MNDNRMWHFIVFWHGTSLLILLLLLMFCTQDRGAVWVALALGAPISWWLSGKQNP